MPPHSVFLIPHLSFLIRVSAVCPSIGQIKLSSQLEVEVYTHTQSLACTTSLCMFFFETKWSLVLCFLGVKM